MWAKKSAERMQWGEQLGTELWTQQTPRFKARAHLLMSDLCIIREQLLQPHTCTHMCAHIHMLL